MLGGENDIKDWRNFDIALDLDKYTSWYVVCIDEILDSDPYTSTSWIGSLYRYCGTWNSNDYLQYSKWSLDEFTTCLYINPGY